MSNLHANFDKNIIINLVSHHSVTLLDVAAVDISVFYRKILICIYKLVK